MSFRDIFTSNFLERMNAVTGLDMAVTLILALFMGLFILFIYTHVYGGTMYSASFGVSLVGLSMITASLILAVSSNVMLSLGMVGALSIVRFRTAIKDPLEIVFLFWSIEVGIVLASGLVIMAVVVNFLIGLTLWLLVTKKTGDPYILILKCDERYLDQAERFMKEHTQSCTLKSAAPDVKRAQTVEEQEDYSQAPQVVIEKVFEVTLGDGENGNASFIGKLAHMDGVEKALLATYNGAYMG